jgi:trimeric autotransporter adhesin
MTTKKQQKNVILSTLKGLMGETYGTKLFNWLTSVNDGFLKTATGLTTTAQNVTDNEGTASPLFLADNQMSINTLGNFDCTIIGVDAGQGTGFWSSVIIGDYANKIGTGNNNTLIGNVAGSDFTTAHDNCYIGAVAGAGNAVGNNNVGIGVFCLSASTMGSNNVSIGRFSSHRQQGNGNVAIGHESHVGQLPNNANTGEYNISIGYLANNTLTTGSENICIGKTAYASSSIANNELNIGNALYAININNGGSGTPGADPQFAIGKVTPDASAILDLNSTTTRGVIPPNLTTVQRNAIVSPADTLLVFDTDLDTLCFYSVTLAGWRQVSHSTA